MGKRIMTATGGAELGTSLDWTLWGVGRGGWGAGHRVQEAGETRDSQGFWESEAGASHVRQEARPGEGRQESDSSLPCGLLKAREVRDLPTD